MKIQYLDLALDSAFDRFTPQAEVLSLEASLEQKQRNLEEQKPVFEELENYFKQRYEEYDNMKKTIGG